MASSWLDALVDALCLLRQPAPGSGLMDYGLGSCLRNCTTGQLQEHVSLDRPIAF